MSEYTAYVYPDDRERFLREAEEILAKGQAYEHNHRIVRPDGEILTFFPSWISDTGWRWHESS